MTRRVRARFTVNISQRLARFARMARVGGDPLKKRVSPRRQKGSTDLMRSPRNFAIRWRRTSACWITTAARWWATSCCRVTCTSRPTISPSTATCSVTWRSCWYRRFRCWRSARRRRRVSYRTRWRWPPKRSVMSSARCSRATLHTSWWSRSGTRRWSRKRRWTTRYQRSTTIPSSSRRTGCWLTTPRWTPKRTSRACLRAVPISRRPPDRRPSAPRPTAWLSAGRVCHPPCESSGYFRIRRVDKMRKKKLGLLQLISAKLFYTKRFWELEAKMRRSRVTVKDVIHKDLICFRKIAITKRFR